MVYIYALYDDDNILYVGSSFDVQERFRQHLRKSGRNSCLHNVKDISKIKCVELEETTDELRYATEGFYIEWLNPTLNKNRAGSVYSEIRKIYKQSETYKNYCKEYYIKNKERMLEYQNAYNLSKR